jgi:hypothetical protein
MKQAGIALKKSVPVFKPKGPALCSGEVDLSGKRVASQAVNPMVTFTRGFTDEKAIFGRTGHPHFAGG